VAIGYKRLGRGRDSGDRDSREHLVYRIRGQFLQPLLIHASFLWRARVLVYVTNML
jgi:hypothetical protein